ncbi:MAG: NTP transferase domain-containing protein [Bernardetiaceae bacterium]|jgi:molybdopterin-guanine dinucleotide biosynthesis protein A|nr:NTP transferase domain-containing protein [Bernardetiaceae bacterium]
MAQHHDHPQRPALGHFARTELAILGTPCGKIKQLAQHLLAALGREAETAYVDADHAGADDPTQTPPPALAAGANLVFTDKISHSRFDFSFAYQPKAKGYERDADGRPWLSQLPWRQFFQAAHLVVVNGNHFEASAQIAVVDPAKPLEKKLTKLTHVVLVLLAPGVTEVPAYLQAHLASLGLPPPVLAWENFPAIEQWLRAFLQAAQPPLYGLVLAGGQSRRMGHDKGLIAYHGRPQREYALDLLAPFCERAFISCRPDQVAELAHLPHLPDTFLGLGPLGGILSAGQAHPHAAWLVVACDLPLLTARTLAYLVQHRDPTKTATALTGTDGTGFPEPLICIWEPRAYGQALHFLASGYSCPRKILINSNIKLLAPPVVAELANVNLPAEQQAAFAQLGLE